MESVESDDFVKQLLSLREPMMITARRLCYQNKANAEDLFQDTFIRALKSRDKFDGCNLRAWILVIMRNLFINDYRKKKLAPEMVDIERAYYIAADTSVDENTHFLEELDKAIARLPDKFRRPLELYMSGYLYKEIAETMSAPMGTIQSRLHQAKCKLAKMLELG